MDINSLSSSPLFRGVTPREAGEFIACSGAVQRKYKKGAVVILQGEHNDSVGIVLNGSLRGGRIYESGAEGSVSYIGAGGLFGEILSGGGVPSPVTLVAAESTSVVLIPFGSFSGGCGSAAVREQLLKNLFAGIAEKYFDMRRRLDIISKRTIGERVIKYLSEGVRRDVRRADMADYLCCDRAALSRELSRMREAGIVEITKTDIKLKNKK